MPKWGEVNMAQHDSSKLSIILVIFMASLLQGCGAGNSLCPGKNTQVTDEKKICSGTIKPTIAPYQVIGQFSEQPNLAEIKESLRTATGNTDSDAAIGALRAQALRETALSLGARGGLAEKAQFINNTLLNYEPILDRVFQFGGIILDNNVLPPVLTEAKNTLTLSGNDSIRIADRNYKILSQARFITATPTWREYLWMAYDMPSLPDRSLLPRNKPERIIWERDLEEGWKAGLQQAELIFKENINRLIRDYKGMILYRNLLAQNIVSQPFVAAMDMGITGDGQDMTINDRVLRITAFPELQADSSAWKTELYIHE
jgi:defect-in-organelle-trafficking protein DotC